MNLFNKSTMLWPLPEPPPHLVDDLQDVLELLEALPGGDAEDEDEGVALGDGQPLHRGELVRARRVRDLEGGDGIDRPLPL